MQQYHQNNLQPHGRQNILLVDDDKEVLSLLKIMLEEFGYSVSEFSDSEKALDFFRLDPERFDIVITDIVMPKINGWELVTRIRKITPYIPIVICSGFIEWNDLDLGFPLNVEGYIPKPVTFDKLSKTLRFVLDGRAKT